MPAQTAPVVIAMASQPKKDATKIDHTIGICHLIENPAGSPSAVNSLSPVTAVKIYLWNLEHRAIDKADLKDAKVSLLQSPKHGVLEFFEGTQSAGYLPSSIDYRGPDQATVLVEIGDRKVKVRYFFNVMQSTPPGTEGYDPHEDKKLCPQGKGWLWKISLNPDDPSGRFFTFEQSFTMANTISGFQAEIVFADLPGDAVGQTSP